MENKMENIIKPTRFRVEYGDHFLGSAMRRQFDFSVLVPMYIHVGNTIDTIKRNVDLEFSIGRSTVKYAVINDTTIKLITGWVGNRKKEQVVA